MGRCGRLKMYLESGVSVDMLMGEFKHNIDAKGRLIMPAKFREDLGEKFIITRGMDGCLFGYPEKEWTTLEEKTKTTSTCKKRCSCFYSVFLFRSNRVRIRQARTNQYSSNVKRTCRTRKSMPCYCVSDRIEIWSQDRWEKFSEEAEESFDEIAERHDRNF